jgi:C4-dicarboxylate-specific signal transduction histidine kinase
MTQSLRSLNYTHMTQIAIERDRTQQLLRKAQANLPHATRATMMGQLTASIGHEVNQPTETWGSVQDAGTGFKPEQMNRLFEAFYTSKPQGMGMGLAISRSIIEAHGGRLWAEPNKGSGASFLFSLPAAPEGPGDHGPASRSRTDANNFEL